MIIEEPIGCLGDARFDGLDVDVLDIEWQDAHKKISRRTTRGGIEVGLRLSDGAAARGIRQGDVLFADGRIALAANIVPCKCILVSATERAELVRLCYEAGNHHAPFFFGEGANEFLLPYDAPLFALIEKIGLAPISADARLDAQNRIAGARGGHHQHGHGQQQRHEHEHEHELGHGHKHEHELGHGQQREHGQQHGHELGHGSHCHA